MFISFSATLHCVSRFQGLYNHSFNSYLWDTVPDPGPAQSLAMLSPCLHKTFSVEGKYRQRSRHRTMQQKRQEAWNHRVYFLLPSITLSSKPRKSSCRAKGELYFQMVWGAELVSLEVLDFENRWNLKLGFLEKALWSGSIFKVFGVLF